jgi:hypothetical protein
VGRSEVEEMKEKEKGKTVSDLKIPTLINDWGTVGGAKA